MIRWLMTAILLSFSIAWAGGEYPRQTVEYSTFDGHKTVRSVTPGNGFNTASENRHRPIRNPHLLAQVVWVDRNHELAIAANVATSPDGSNIFAGWWLNNQRYAAYASAGLEAPLWRYRQTTPWTMPVAASDRNFSGTGSGLPVYLWDKDSPLFTNQLLLDPGYDGAGVSFSGDGNILAFVSSTTTDAMLTVYDMTAQDTIFTRHFDPAQGLYGVDVSDDGSVVVVSCYSQLNVYEIPSGNFRGGLYNYSQGTAKISGDGSLIANGTFAGSVYLFEWDGIEYSTRWIRATQDDWVTAVDISNDGSTVACGTLDFTGGQISGGKFMMWDADSATVLIDYSEYGDEVASVALSADGRYAIAGSYGQYGTTFGDVVTCFIRDSDVPIFQLLDDLDEPGSVFSVAISDSGHYAAAGGKAVNAREFGNGGMLYSIQVRDPLLNDAAVAAIDTPGEFMALGENIAPTATFINVGSSFASFAVACTVTNLQNNQVIYSAIPDLVNLASFGTEQVAFSPDFVLPSEGRFRMAFSASLDGDQDTTNDKLELVLRSWHDLQGVSVGSPFDKVTVGWPCIPTVTFKNMGSYTETFDITSSIRDSSGAEVYSAYNTVYDLSPYTQEEVAFDGWIPDVNGQYTIIYNAAMDGDYTPSDNNLTKNFQVVQEMIYDDGSSEMAYWVDAYPNSTNRKFAQFFDPNVTSAFHVTNFRFYQPSNAYTGYFDYAGIAADDGSGFPDTSSLLVKVDNPRLPGPDNWASYDVSLNSDYQPLWVVLHWADTEEPGPYVGADNNGHIDQHSYWYSDNNGWNRWLFSDWMIRMTVAEGTDGIGSNYYSGLPEKISLAQNYPNPFNPTTNINFGLPNGSNVKLDIFNTLGQKVRTLTNGYFDAGYHSLMWDGKSDNGSEISSGVYYYRLTAGDFRISRKMTILK
jgi:hypothetical protein